MKTRNKSYADYGISNKEVERIFARLLTTNESEKKAIREMFARGNADGVRDKWDRAGLPLYVIPSVSLALFEHIGYNTLVKHYDLDLRKEDFYGYKRKGVYLAKCYFVHNKIEF